MGTPARVLSFAWATTIHMARCNARPILARLHRGARCCVIVQAVLGDPGRAGVALNLPLRHARACPDVDGAQPAVENQALDGARTDVEQFARVLDRVQDARSVVMRYSTPPALAPAR
jgi:hypothetical protein